VKVLITGGAGYIGSTIASACVDDGLTPVIVDNLSTGAEAFLEGRESYIGDMADHALLDKVFQDHPDIIATIHCGALIVVPDSVREPLRYYRENVGKSVELIDGLVRNGCRRIIFSSTAAVYGQTGTLVVDESLPAAPSSPYGRTKAMIEDVLRDSAEAFGLGALALRYFNPIGADPQLRTGLQTRRPTHLLGRLIEAAETGAPLTVTGVDWPTRDGTGIRDYVHVWDLARAHVAAVRNFDVVCPPGSFGTANLGSGSGCTVLEMVEAFAEVSGTRVPVEHAPRRHGDVPGGYARWDRAHELFGWRPTLTLQDGIRDALRWIDARPAVLGA
jgi:UDP-glucose 4-epimerase